MISTRASHWLFGPLAGAIILAGISAGLGQEASESECEGLELGASNRLDGVEFRGYEGTLFTDWDDNGDGVLSWDEFQDCLGPVPLTFRQMDRNGNGVISRAEYYRHRGGIYDKETTTIGGPTGLDVLRLQEPE